MILVWSSTFFPVVQHWWTPISSTSKKQFCVYAVQCLLSGGGLYSGCSQIKSSDTTFLVFESWYIPHFYRRSCVLYNSPSCFLTNHSSWHSILPAINKNVESVWSSRMSANALILYRLPQNYTVVPIKTE